MYSKEGQDVLVKSFIKGKGFFLDIGCGLPIHANNSYLLELFGWNGLLIDFDEFNVKECREKRKSPVFNIDCENFSNKDWFALLKNNSVPKVIDYISLDVDYSNINVINNFPFDEYEFKIMTFETDVYRFGDIIKNSAEKILSKYNFYSLLLGNAILGDGRIWEDWWVNLKFINYRHLHANNVYWFDFLNKIKNNRYKLLL